MFYRILLLLCCGFLLSACSPQEKQTQKEVRTEANVEVKVKPYTRVITEEEQKYIQLVINKNYNAILE